MNIRNVKILGTGEYVPATTLTDLEMDERLGMPPGWSRRTTDVQSRHFAAPGERAAVMGARAAEAALEAASLALEDVDCLVCASGTRQQALPCTAVFIQEAMQAGQSGIPAFDIDATCLSFLTALDVMSSLVAVGRYRRVLIVSAEIASVGLDWTHKESAALFGDGAAAAVIGPADEAGPSRILAASLRTYSAGAAFSEIRAGGTLRHPDGPTPAAAQDYRFAMNGPAIFKMASRLLPDFARELLTASDTTMAAIQAVVPHQGSALAMRLLERKLGIAREQLVYITPTRGNTIAASIPMGLHAAIGSGRVKRGDRVLLLGTAAGLTLGGVVLDY
ncbi:beta-ketoacyl-ACP synthase III [Paenibacillus sp. IB182496]|uniref:Beta-ketoacyl-ACP synthase III n=1 Tax=Paenibacillus sabuli TaxID=2772509 RepID=A0A927GTZ3_9BACL|nr:beta-ketoacyl-ACP synthase III [Paenibacillus sabuli]MBD2847605.1 beta-ketoacyl-ACP synthase III [Paenibacillus sabuli]